MPDPTTILLAAMLTITGPVTHVVDGDTLVIQGQSIRLREIDAPELRQPCWDGDGVEWRCGQEARSLLVKLAAGQVVACTEVRKAAWYRLDAYCSVGGRDLGEAMIAAGLAAGDPQYASGRYVDALAEAQRTRRGVWGARWVAPWEWRESRRKSQ